MVEYLQFVHQEPTELVLAIAHQAVPDLTVLKQSVVLVDNWAFVFQIVGESHSVLVRHDDRLVLQEILACAEVPATELTHYHSFATLSDHRFQHDEYAIEVHFSTDDSLLYNPDLEVHFPGARDPATRIKWEREGNSMRWWTSHIYPGQRQTTHVQSVSVFRMKERIHGNSA